MPTLEALTYAGEIGVDVVNMSYFTDPWLYNCLNSPADTPAEQAEQRTIREATQRAINFARNHGVLPVAAEGNEATDLNNPTEDTTSPDYPPGTEKDRTVNNSCITVPTETRGVVAVSATGVSTRKAYYSNYGTEQTDVSAPGGDFYDSPDNTGNPRNIVLAAYPKALAILNGDLNPDGTPNNDFVVQSCDGDVCGYYQYLQGTSMASPHAVGVAALIVSQYGKADRVHGGLTLAPSKTENILSSTAVEHACPQPRAVPLHPDPGRRLGGRGGRLLRRRDREERLLRPRHRQRVRRGHRGEVAPASRRPAIRSPPSRSHLPAPRRSGRDRRARVPAAR